MEPENEKAEAPKPTEEEPIECLPPFDGPGLPPELRTVPRADLKEALRLVRAYVLKTTRSRELADDIVPDTFAKITRTRRWDPSKGPFSRHFMLCIKSELNHHFESKKPKKEAEAREGFQREELPTHAASAEDFAVREETEAERAAIDEAKAARELALLREKTESHPLMPKVVECLERGLEGPRAIADDLGVPVESIYRALELLRHHMKKIRATLDEEKT